MPGKKSPQTETAKSKPEKRDILTEMFEHFGIKVTYIDTQAPKPSKKIKKLK